MQRVCSGVTDPESHLKFPLNTLPWDIAEESLGRPGAVFVAGLGQLLLQAAKDQRRPQVLDSS